MQKRPSHSSPSSSSKSTPTVDVATSTPLASHPQLEIITTPLSSQGGSHHVEYRVYPFRQAANGQVIRSDGWGGRDLMFVVGLIWLAWTLTLAQDFKEVLSGEQAFGKRIHLLIWLLVLSIYLRTKCQTVLYESIIPLPGIGIQLSATRGLSFPSLPFRTSHSAPSSRIRLKLSLSNAFIPLSDVSTVILHQGLRRFRVEYYLAIVLRGGKGVVVGFKEIRPPFGVLREVYHGVREMIFDEYRSGDEDDGQVS